MVLSNYYEEQKLSNYENNYKELTCLGKSFLLN